MLSRSKKLAGKCDTDANNFPPENHLKVDNIPNFAQKTITDLPEEVLQLILKFVVGSSDSHSSKGFLDLSLVSKKWNDSLSSSVFIMSKLKMRLVFKIHVKNAEYHLYSVYPTRSYRKLHLIGDVEFTRHEIDRLKKLPQSFPSVSSCISSFVNLRELEVSNFNYSISRNFTVALNALTHLESLSFGNCNINELDVLEEMQLKKLKTLEITWTEILILRYIRCKQLNSLKVARTYLSDDFVEFLNHLECLETLVINDNLGKYWSNCTSSLTPNFSWKKLEFHAGLYEGASLNCIISLVRASALDAVANIIIDSSNLNNRYHKFYESFLNSCNKIKTLTVNGDYEFTQDMSNLRVMDEVEELTIDLKIDGVEKLIRKLPNVEKLNLLDEFCPTKLTQMAALMNNLQHLDVTYNVFNNYEGLTEPTVARITSLQSLTVHPRLEKEAVRNPESRVRVGSTVDVWRFCAVNRTVKHVIMNVCIDSSQPITIVNGQESQNSPIHIYNEWLANGNTSVESCSLIISIYDGDRDKLKISNRSDIEFAFFGRLLNEDERRFFADIHLNFE